MKFHIPLRTQCPAKWSLLLVVLFLAFPSFSQAQATRARKVMPEPKKAAPKATAKPKVVSALELKAAKARLAELGYWFHSDAESFRHAVIAFQKVQELRPTGKLSYEDLEVLRSAATPAPKETQKLAEDRIRVEVDLQRQVLFVINHENQVTKILSISSGNSKEFTSEGFVRDAVTPPGRFNVYNKIKGWKKSPLGMLYYPNYYLSGLAVHGSTFVPAYPDSHGCIRIPMYAAEEFYQLATIGTEILVYGKPKQKE